MLFQKIKQRLHTVELVLTGLIDELSDAKVVTHAGLQRRITENSLKAEQEAQND